VANWRWGIAKALFRVTAIVSMSYVDIHSPVFKRTSFYFFRVKIRFPLPAQGEIISPVHVVGMHLNFYSYPDIQS
jgi:hypothetical protein